MIKDLITFLDLKAGPDILHMTQKVFFACIYQNFEGNILNTLPFILKVYLSKYTSKCSWVPMQENS